MLQDNITITLVYLFFKFIVIISTIHFKNINLKIIWQAFHILLLFLVNHFSNQQNLNGTESMALKATIYKANIELADMDRNYYDSLQLTLAQHPSETDQRFMVRLICFILNAHNDLQFGKGVSDEDEAPIWQINCIKRTNAFCFKIYEQ